MSSPAAELAKAIRTALLANSAITALVSTRVYIGGSRQNVSLPYIDLGEVEERDWSTKTETGSEHFVTIHVWSEKPGIKEIEDLKYQIKQSLHDQALTVASNQLVNIRFQDGQTFRDPDGKTRHGIVNYKAFTVEN